MLDLSGIGRERLQVRWVSSAEGQLFAEYVSDISSTTRKLGAFDPNKFKFPIAAAERTLNSPRIRWLLGLTKQLTKQGNVYNEKLTEDDFRELMHRAVQEEYQKALIVESLKGGPRSVMEVAKETGLPIYTVSLRLNDLERSNQASLKEYKNSTPIFMGV